MICKLLKAKNENVPEATTTLLAVYLDDTLLEKDVMKALCETDSHRILLIDIEHKYMSTNPTYWSRDFVATGYEFDPLFLVAIHSYLEDNLECIISGETVSYNIDTDELHISC